jgi:hypothetical protein
MCRGSRGMAVPALDEAITGGTPVPQKRFAEDQFKRSEAMCRGSRGMAVPAMDDGNHGRDARATKRFAEDQFKRSEAMCRGSRGMAVPAMDDGNHGRDARATKAIRGRPVQTERSDMSPDAGALHSRHSILLRR